MFVITGLANYVEIFGFLLIFTLVYALLAKTKILGDNNFIHLFVSFIISILFVVVPPATKYITSITPWIAVFFVVVVFIVLTVTFISGKTKIEDVMNPGIAWAFVIIIIIILLISAIQLFHLFAGLEPLKQWALQPRIYTALILFAVAAAAAWVLAHGGKVTPGK